MGTYWLWNNCTPFWRTWVVIWGVFFWQATALLLLADLCVSLILLFFWGTWLGSHAAYDRYRERRDHPAPDVAYQQLINDLERRQALAAQIRDADMREQEIAANERWFRDQVRQVRQR